MIDQLLACFSGMPCTVISFTQISHASIPDDSLVVLSGSSGLPIQYFPETYADEIELIKTHNGPIIGVCFGFEILAYAFGTTLKLQKERSKGITTIYVTDPYPLEIGSYKVYESHRWVVEKVTEPLVGLAYSDTGIEIIRHTVKPLYGLQFHPESTYDADGKALLGRIIEAIRM